jgi:DNA-binding PadR family transcriptional regulator
MPRSFPKHSSDFQSGTPARPQGAPRGLLVYYILYRIAQKPVHGYEILQDIDSKTEGAWRPGPGSIYPLLKKLVTEGLIKVDPSSVSEQHVYHITPNGKKHLEEARQMFADVAKKWTSMRRIFMELMDARDLGSFFIDGSRAQFQIAQDTMESKIKHLSPSEARFILREYALNLERQSEWCDSFLRSLKRNSSEERKSGSGDLDPISTVSAEAKK